MQASLFEIDRIKVSCFLHPPALNIPVAMTTLRLDGSCVGWSRLALASVCERFGRSSARVCGSCPSSLSRVAVKSCRRRSPSSFAPTRSLMAQEVTCVCACAELKGARRFDAASQSSSTTQRARPRARVRGGDRHQKLMRRGLRIEMMQKSVGGLQIDCIEVNTRR